MKGITPSRIPHEPPEVQQAEIEAFRASSLTQRGRWLTMACRSAARLQRSHQKAGLADVEPDPWPESTWQFLNKHALHGKKHLVWLALLLVAICRTTSAFEQTQYQGFGAATNGGDSGQLVAVTSLADSGPGTLRAALQSGNRRIVFQVGGSIQLKSSLAVTQSNVTVDGSGAPNPGITVVGMPFVIQDACDVIVRHLRFRESANDNIRIIGASQNVVIDHCSSTRAKDGALDITLDYKSKKFPRDITVSWCLLAGTEKAMLVDTVANLSIHHNLFTNNSQRSPQLHNVKNFDLRNNAIGFWLAHGARGRAGSTGNIVNNVFGPSMNPKKRLEAALIHETTDATDGRGKTPVFVDGNLAPSPFDPNQLGTARRAIEAPAVNTSPAPQLLSTLLKSVGAQPTDEVDREYLKLSRETPYRSAKD